MHRDSKMSENKFYRKAASYWANIPATIDGVLGGFGHISDTDIAGSKAFLHRIFSLDNPPANNLALDCGAGIGRVSTNLLIHNFNIIDLVEQDEKFLATAKRTLGESNPKVGNLYRIGLQNFKPQKKYDVIWCQWVLGYLSDYDLINFLVRCREALAVNGFIIVKENVTSTEEIEYDDDDSSVTRPRKLMQQIFKEARLTVVLTDVQIGFPEDIYPVHMFALSPKPKAMQVQIV